MPDRQLGIFPPSIWRGANSKIIKSAHASAIARRVHPLLEGKMPDMVFGAAR